MLKQGYETFDVTWRYRIVTVCHQANWLGTGHWHIELRCQERLPVTATGYRSLFVPQAVVADQNDLRAFVTDLLDEAAKSKDWMAHVEDCKQLKLF
jgi:hypothetical protein